MELYFNCPVTDKLFSSKYYALQKGFRVVDVPGHVRKIEGWVELTKPCPLCGVKHRYEAGDVLCPLAGGIDEK